MWKTRWLEIYHTIHHTKKKKLLICDLYQEMVFAR
jgi:hypothetical protein